MEKVSAAGIPSSKSDISDRKGLRKRTDQDKDSNKCTFLQPRSDKSQTNRKQLTET